MSLLQFIKAVPWNVRRGSGCYVGTRILVDALRNIGIDVALITPRIVTPMYTATRVLFNEILRCRRFRGSRVHFQMADHTPSFRHIDLTNSIVEFGTFHVSLY